MTAATTSRATSMRVGTTIHGLLAATALVLAGTMVCRDAAGNIVDGDQDDDLHFAGVSRQDVDNSTGIAGDEGAELWTDGEFLLASAGLAAGDEGKEVFLLDNQTVVLGDHPGLTHRIKVGTIAEVVSATAAWVRIQPQRVEIQQFTVQVAGVNATDFDLSAAAAAFGGSDFHVLAVQAVEAFVTASGASDGLRVVTTDWTLTDGVLAAVADESLNTWRITFTAALL